MSGDPLDDFDDPFNDFEDKPDEEQTYAYDSQGDQPSMLRPAGPPVPNQVEVHSSSAPSSAQTFWRAGPDAHPWDRALEGMKDAGYSAAGGVLSGAGLNPGQTLGNDVRESLQVANERSPTAAPLGKLGGEMGIQALGGRYMRGAAPVVQGVVSGGLSALGNADTNDWGEKLNAIRSGSTIGGVTAGLVGTLTGAASKYGAGKIDDFAEGQSSHGLMNRGADTADLKRFDTRAGGRQQLYDDANRLGITGGPSSALKSAKRVTGEQEALRNEIEARNAGVQVDPNAAAAAVRGANPYPGIDRMDSAASRAAAQVQRGGTDFGSMDVKRAYYGNDTNFASGTPNATLGKGVHGAINNEMEDALNLAEPGAGSTWRQAGHDTNVGIEMRGAAQGGVDRARDNPIKGGDVWTLGATRFANANRHAVAEKGFGALKNVAKAGDFISEWGNGLPASAAGNVAGGVAGQSASLADTALNSIAAGGADLGDYRDQFAQAAASPDHGAVSNLITRLTMSDPKFRTTTLKRLRELGAM